MKTEHEIETLLSAERRRSLSVADKELIKTQLLAEVNRTLDSAGAAIPSPWTVWFARGALSFASLLLIVVGTAYASYDSLPGEPLYSMKVRVVEEFEAMTKLDTEARTAYTIELLERRYAELRTLSQEEPGLASVDLALFSDQVSDHVETLVDVYEQQAFERDGGTGHPARIRSLAKISGLVKAQADYVADHTSQETGGADQLQDTYEIATEAVAAEAASFVESVPAEVVQLYLSNQVDEIGDSLIMSTSTDVLFSVTVDYLQETDTHLREGDLLEAVV